MNNEIELTAALLTIEKCRELSCCPAGVDLQDWVKQLAEENLTMKDAIECHKAGFTVCEACGEENGSWNDDVCRALDDIPATDRIVAGIKAAIEYPENNSSSKGWTIDPEFLSRVAERAGAFYGYHPGLEETEAALLAGLDLLREGADKC
ncbi:TPA: hypothetical protein ACTXAG_003167 [Klebsiella oxytoca]